MFFLMQNIFIVPVMQHGCRAKPLLSFSRLTDLIYLHCVLVVVFQELQDTAADVIGVDKYHQVGEVQN